MPKSRRRSRRASPPSRPASTAPASSCGSTTPLKMNPEDSSIPPGPTAWQRLGDRAASQLSAGFADEVLRRARLIRSGPSSASQLTLGVATAALCFLGVALFQSQSSRAEESKSVASWQQIASASDDASLAQ